MSRLEGAPEEEREEKYARSVSVRNGGKERRQGLAGLSIRGTSKRKRSYEISATCAAKFSICGDRRGSLRTRLRVFIDIHSVLVVECTSIWVRMRRAAGLQRRFSGIDKMVSVREWLLFGRASRTQRIPNGGGTRSVRGGRRRRGIRKRRMSTSVLLDVHLRMLMYQSRCRDTRGGCAVLWMGVIAGRLGRLGRVGGAPRDLGGLHLRMGVLGWGSWDRVRRLRRRGPGDGRASRRRGRWIVVEKGAEI